MFGCGEDTTLKNSFWEETGNNNTVFEKRNKKVCEEVKEEVMELEVGVELEGLCT